MKPVIIAPLVALALAAGGAGAYFWVTGEGPAEEVSRPPSALDTPGPSPTAQPTPTPAETPTATPEPSPSGPAAWLSYTDPVLGFSLDYPEDLMVKDVTGPSPDGQSERAIEFRSPEDQSRGFAISVSPNPQGLSLQQWAVEYAACRPKSTQQGTLGGSQAIFCTREVIEGRAHPAVLAEQSGRMFLVSGNLTDSEFTQLTGSFEF